MISVDETASTISWPYSALDQMLMGMRQGTDYAGRRGSGCGKTTFCKEVAYHLMMSGRRSADLALEKHRSERCWA